MQVQRVETQSYGIAFRCAAGKTSGSIKRFLTFEQSEGKEVNILTERLSKLIKSSKEEHKKNRARTLLNLREKGIVVRKMILGHPLKLN